MGRILVLPPKSYYYLLWHSKDDEQNQHDYSTFFDIPSIIAKYPGIVVITFEEFLKREALTGNLRDKNTTAVSFPPGNTTNWSGRFRNTDSTRTGDSKILWEWMRSVAVTLEWNFDQCVAAIPSELGSGGTTRLHQYLQNVLSKDAEQFPASNKNSRWMERLRQYNLNPTAVDASPVDRLRELLGNREKLCVYDDELQNARVVHGLGETKTS